MNQQVDLQCEYERHEAGSWQFDHGQSESRSQCVSFENGKLDLCTNT